MFAKEIEELLVKQKDNAVLLSNFMASYVKHFGQKFKVALFGFSRLTDLIKAIPDVAEVSRKKSLIIIFRKCKNGSSKVPSTLHKTWGNLIIDKEKDGTEGKEN